jgi:16S rRNA processing protein RimM
MGPAGDAIVVLGDVVGAYGVHGAVKVRPYTEVPETLLQYPTWWVKPARETQWRPLSCRNGRLHSGALLAELSSIDSREAALALKGAEIGVPRAMLPAAGAGEIYVDALVGLAVANRAGAVLGEVAGVVEHGAHPLLQVARPEGSPGAARLIPFVPAIVVEVDMDARRIVVDWGEDF